MKAWSQNDDLFFSELGTGRKFERYVAMRLLEKGFVVEFPKQEIRKSIDEAGEFANQADVYVGRWGQKPIKIEVKSRDLEFASPDDFQYRDIFVTTLSSWRSATQKPSAVLCVSQTTGAIIATSTSHRGAWERKQKTDRVRGTTDVFLTAHRKLWCSFDAFCDSLGAALDARG